LGLKKGVHSALVTPLNNGKVDRKLVTRIIERLVTSGCAGVLVAGTTGEGPLLSEEQWETIVRVVVKQAEGKLSVMIGTSGITLSQTIDYLKKSSVMGGAVEIW